MESGESRAGGSAGAIPIVEYVAWGGVEGGCRGAAAGLRRLDPRKAGPQPERLPHIALKHKGTWAFYSQVWHMDAVVSDGV
jgi:hypothetical protein